VIFEPTTLAATALAIAEAVEPYGCDADEIFRRAGLDMETMGRLGARYPFRSMTRLWAEARAATEDPCIGLFAGQKLRTPGLHALGFSWLASPTLLDGLHRIERYVDVASTAIRIEIIDDGDLVRLVVTAADEQHQPASEALDACFTIIVKMCRTMANPNVAPLSVSFRHPDYGHIDQYIKFFDAPIEFSAQDDELRFDRHVLELPLPAGNRELAYENDRIAERYLATLNPDRVQDKVREILLTLLPSGEANQQTVASNLNRSVSSLQRQLKAEGATYKQILEETRNDLAQRLVAEERYSLSQIAYLLGFSDQANFSRAFRRWTGTSPSEFRTGAGSR
jgi:AraC-like DNA-binding protein